MPIIFRFYIKHCLIGFGISAVFVALLIYFNVANLGHLILGSDIAVLALTVFWILNGIVFAGVQTGVAVMLMSEDEAAPPNGPGTGALVPIRQEKAKR